MNQTVTCYDCGAVLDAGYQSYHRDLHDLVGKLKRQVRDLEEKVRKLERR